MNKNVDGLFITFIVGGILITFIGIAGGIGRYKEKNKLEMIVRPSVFC